MEATTQETAGMGVSATNKIERLRGRKTRWSIFHEDSSSRKTAAQVVGAQGWVFH
jgi:hypothetical protein